MDDMDEVDDVDWAQDSDLTRPCAAVHQVHQVHQVHCPARSIGSAPCAVPARRPFDQARPARRARRNVRLGITRRACWRGARRLERPPADQSSPRLRPDKQPTTCQRVLPAFFPAFSNPFHRICLNAAADYLPRSENCRQTANGAFLDMERRLHFITKKSRSQHLSNEFPPALPFGVVHLPFAVNGNAADPGFPVGGGDPPQCG